MGFSAGLLTLHPSVIFRRNSTLSSVHTRRSALSPYFQASGWPTLRDYPTTYCFGAHLTSPDKMQTAVGCGPDYFKILFVCTAVLFLNRHAQKYFLAGVSCSTRDISGLKADVLITRLAFPFINPFPHPEHTTSANFLFIYFFTSNGVCITT